MKEIHYCKLYECSATRILQPPQIHLFGTMLYGEKVPELR